MITTSLEPAIGRGVLPFVDGSNPDRPLEVNYFRPASHGPDDPVVIVQHGMMRNGDDYRDFWIPAAEKHNLLIIAPTFPNAHFPKAEGYNNGLVIGEDGAVRARENWLYGIPARVFEALRRSGVTRRAKARIFGHSAGGQFLHRLLATQDHAPFEAAMAANSGWYTLPMLDRPFPEGLGELGLNEAALARWLAYPMIIFAGNQDINTGDPNLPAGSEALAQGEHRYARAHFMHDFAKREAARLAVPFNWQILTVDGIGHDGAAMSRAAASWWFQGRIPAFEELQAGSAPVL